MGQMALHPVSQMALDPVSHQHGMHRSSTPHHVFLAACVTAAAVAPSLLLLRESAEQVKGRQRDGSSNSIGHMQRRTGCCSRTALRVGYLGSTGLAGQACI